MQINSKYGIKDLAKEDRPREKLLEKGLFSLTDAELIAIILGSGSRKESALELAQKILKEYHNNLKELGKATAEQLINKFHGVGNAKAISIVAAMELGRRYSLQKAVNKPLIAQSVDIDNIMRPLLSDLNHEEFWVLLLNRANRVIMRFNVSKGGIDKTFIDIRMIFKIAIEHNAISLILCHNHPSGNLKPSLDDIKLTNKIVETSKIMDIKVIDHVIICENGYFSFIDENML